MSDAGLPTRSPDKRKGCRWAHGALFALPLLGLLVGLYVHLSAAADRELRDALADADRLDAGWRREDLEAARAPVPDDRNAALIVLDLTNGDVRRVMRFSRHRSVQTVLKYDDARRDGAGELARCLADDLG